MSIKFLSHYNELSPLLNETRKSSRTLGSILGHPSGETSKRARLGAADSVNAAGYLPPSERSGFKVRESGFEIPEIPLLQIEPEIEQELSPEAPRVVGVRRSPEVILTGKEEIARKIHRFSSEASVNSDLALALAQQESGLQSSAVSKDGFATKGIFQLKDSTGREILAEHFPEETYTPLDAEQNIRIGLNHLRKLHTLFEVPREVLPGISTFKAANSAEAEKFSIAAFNAGEGRVAKAQNLARANGLDPSSYESIQRYLPATTRSYVSSVLALQEKIAS